MKKLLFFALLVMVSSTTFAQNTHYRQVLEEHQRAHREREFWEMEQRKGSSFSSSSSSSSSSSYRSRFELEYSLCATDDEKIKVCTNYIQSEPNNCLYYHYRGITYRNKGDYVRAIADFTEAIRLYPEWSDIYYARGLAYHSIGNYDRAIADFNEAIRLNPKMGHYYRHRGFAYEHKNELALARADYAKARELGY